VLIPLDKSYDFKDDSILKETRDPSIKIPQSVINSFAFVSKDERSQKLHHKESTLPLINSTDKWGIEAGKVEKLNHTDQYFN